MLRINLLFLFVAAPLIGILITVSAFGQTAGGMVLPTRELNMAVTTLKDESYNLQYAVGFMHESLEEQQQNLEEQQRILEQLSQKTVIQKNLSDDVYEQHILDKLGPPVRVHRSARVEVKVFHLKGIGYRGYIAKVKPFDPTVLRVVHNPVDGETTLGAVRRTGAIFGINGGGFFQAPGGGKMHVIPIGNTMVDGKLIRGFQPSKEDIFFIGFDGRGKLVGAICHDQSDLTRLGARQGVSFVPILIHDQKPLPIPQKWQNQRQPRTIVGEYANGDMIFIVVDGRQADWSSGVTLEDLQVTLIKFGVVDAYNLDGGGSSVFVFGNEIMNRPADGKQRMLPTNIVVMP